MNSLCRNRLMVLVLFVSGLGAAPQRPAVEKQDPVQLYPLTPKNGPWMIRVKSFQGPQAVELANELARELREEHKIQAYTLVMRQDQQTEVVQAGMTRGRVRQYEAAGVLVGDFPNEKAATKTLEKIKAIRPKCITREMTSEFQWQTGVLRTAFLIPNPLLPKNGGDGQKLDPLLLKINKGQYNLFNCPGDYSLQVMYFSGGVAYTEEHAKKLEKASLLEAAGEHAEQLTHQLRKMGYEAYAFHTMSASLVAVGSFASEKDPQIETLKKQMATMKVGTFQLSPIPEVVRVPKKNSNESPTARRSQ